MTVVQFYHLTKTPLTAALPKLLERAVAGGYRVCVTVQSGEQVEQFDRLLWTYEESSFLPHGSDKDENPEIQPILLSVNATRMNGANLLVIPDGRKHEPGEFERVLDIFDGGDGEAVAAARKRWAEYKEQGCELTYFFQNENGGWVKK